MKLQKQILQLVVLLVYGYGFAQNTVSDTIKKQSVFRQISVEPGIGFHANHGHDLLITTLLQWNPSKYLAFGSHSSYNINNPFQREFSGIKTEYNYSINQKFGVGLTLTAKKSTHTVFLMAGFKYTSFKETIIEPGLENNSTSINTWSPDYGLMYSYKLGLKKYFFTMRTYIPLYPWGVKGTDPNYLDGNLNNIALELGIGIKLK